MARVARIVVPGVPHHITQRGNNAQKVFFNDDHCRFYLELLKNCAEQFDLDVWAYCLMPNHVHLVATPARADSLAKALGRTHFQYAQFLNRSLRRSGHLWQNRFYSCALEDDYLWRAMRFVERNPVRARFVRVPWTYPWSSAAAHVAGTDPTGTLNMTAWSRTWKPGRWADALRNPDEEGADLLCANTRTGRPIGGERFLTKIERRLHRRVRARPVGRPRVKARRAAKRPRPRSNRG